ncbi:hypothetical protein PIB30_019510 [Stylosanthes scabra]|uniref:Uncharacterized protein n=1 Tax=Stylosanthes scabra TaxID=79078 RepID=A0ABU6V6F9_9FABA|nr:hypothetical protein [Stylosanthes scabra]
MTFEIHKKRFRKVLIQFLHHSPTKNGNRITLNPQNQNHQQHSNGREDSNRIRRNTQEKSKTPLRGIKQGHFFRSLTTTVASMFDYLKDYPDKLRLVNEMGFGALSHLPANNLDQQLLKQIYDRFDIHDNTIYSDAAAVKLTTRKIGDALGLCSKVVRKNLSQEDKDVHKFFQGKTAVELTELVHITPLDTEENKKLFMRAFILFIQKAFLLPNSIARIVPTALTTIFDLENFGENSKEVEARALWIAYWKGDTLKKRLKQERTHEAGLVKTGEMMAKKDISKGKNPTMRVSPSRRDADSDSEATESNLAAESEPGVGPEPEPEPEHDARDEPQPQREIRSKKQNDRAVVGSNVPVIRTQQSVVEPE